LVKRIAREQDMTGGMVSRQGRQSRQDIRTGLPETDPNVFGKATKGLSEMQIRGMNEIDQLL